MASQSNQNLKARFGRLPTGFRLNIVAALLLLAGAGSGFWITEQRQEPFWAIVGIAAGVVAAMSPRVADQWERNQRDCTESKNGSYCKRRILIVGIDRTLGGDDCRDAADRRSYGKQCRQLRLQLKQATEQSHEKQRPRDFDDDQAETDAT